MRRTLLSAVFVSTALLAACAPDPAATQGPSQRETTSTAAQAPQPAPGPATTDEAPEPATTAEQPSTSDGGEQEQETPLATRSSQPADADPGSWLLSPDGWGEINVGGAVPEGLRDSFTPAQECLGPTYRMGSVDLVEVFTEGDDQLDQPVTYIAASGQSPVKTIGGISVGSPESEIKLGHPQAQQREGQWTQTGITVYEDRGMPNSLWFEVVDGAVSAISVQPTEGFLPVSWSRDCVR